MKKQIISLIIAGITFPAFAQNNSVVAPELPVDSITKKITYTEVVVQKGIKDTLYNRAIHWTSMYFKNPQDVTKERNQGDGRVKGIYRFKVYNTALKDGTRTEGGTVSFTFIIECKENKYRYKITDMNLKGVSYFAVEKWLNKNDPSYIPEWDNYLAQTDAYMKEFAKSLKKGMTEAAKTTDDW